MEKKYLSVLITGCSSGIGLALATEFAKRGHQVFATARNVETLKDIKGKSVTTLPLDVTNADSIDKAVKSAIEKAGRIDVLINNAGFGLMGPVAEISLDDFRKQLETNVVGPLAVTQAVFPHMAKQKNGRIVNVESVSGVFTTPFSGAYCSSKSALHSLSDAMRMEFSPWEIKVITLQPGGVISNFGEKAAKLAATVIKPDSLYAPISRYIKNRARAGQKNAMKADQFAKKVISVITSDNPPPVYRLGTLSLQLPLFNWALPKGFAGRFLSNKFGLNKLKN